MFKTEDLAQLQKNSELLAEQMKQSFSIFEKKIEDALLQAPEEDKKAIEDVKAVTQRAINLAKMGKAEEANKLLKDFQNGRQSNK